MTRTTSSASLLSRESRAISLPVSGALRRRKEKNERRMTGEQRAAKNALDKPTGEARQAKRDRLSEAGSARPAQSDRPSTRHSLASCAERAPRTRSEQRRHSERPARSATICVVATIAFWRRLLATTFVVRFEPPGRANSGIWAAPFVRTAAPSHYMRGFSHPRPC